MIKAIIIAGFLSLTLAFNAHADDSDRVDQLEKQVQELNLRVSQLESLLNKQPEKAHEVTKSSEGWKSIANWRKLITNLNTYEVQNILGEPNRVDGGVLAVWYYQNGGQVRFFDGKVTQWTEPR